ncbi:exodeoxyribonuclease VII large subunit [Marinihelvus fidelis]|uniref:exodeoxyribonuclease VII large subunit n=1 Tax=Marinihelvus fidelis TaxID=2613842 RepID=UPI001CD4CC4F|nr:exodeoxyribonuclease VII large subunit [Marinihelvus fidelis]
MNREVYTPSELNREVRVHLEAGFPRLWLEGEISNLARPASGHLYFSLKDDRAQIRCALFRQNARSIGFRPENGQLVQVRGRLSLYEPRGDYQLIADTMEAAGEGRLRAAWEALRKQLESEGLFDVALKKPLPAYPRRIAVITSPSGAVIRDIINVLGRRWPLARVRLYPVPVQGDEAPPAIVRALAAVDRHGWADAVIVGRGGGSLEDLWAFNDEAVARAIVAASTPVISAVGHETDTSISDFVADLRAPTPSAAAELLTPDGYAMANEFARQQRRLARAVEDGIRRRAQRLDELSTRVTRQHPGRQLRERQGQLDAARRRLRVALARIAADRQARLAALAQRLRNAGGRTIPAQASQLDALARRLRTAGQRLVPDRHAQLQALARTLNAYSPLPTLQRGYAIVTTSPGGEAITRPADVAPGDTLFTRVAGGEIVSTVTETRDNPPTDTTSAGKSQKR